MIKLQQMIERKRPTVTEFVNQQAFDLTDQYAMNQDSFMIAVAAESFQDGYKSDPSFVKWVASYQISTKDSHEVVHYPMHRCTDEEFTQFYPPDKQSASKVDSLQEAKEFFCLDQKARDHMLFGGWKSGTIYRALDIQILPCASRYISYDGTVSEDDGSCEWDLEQTIEYLGSAMQIIIVTNQGNFMTNKFNEDRVQK